MWSGSKFCGFSGKKKSWERKGKKVPLSSLAPSQNTWKSQQLFHRSCVHPCISKLLECNEYCLGQAVKDTYSAQVQIITLVSRVSVVHLPSETLRALNPSHKISDRIFFLCVDSPRDHPFKMQAKIKEVDCENSTPLLPLYNVLFPKISAVTYFWDSIYIYILKCCILMPTTSIGYPKTMVLACTYWCHKKLSMGF